MDRLTALTAGWRCKKRSGEVAPFDPDKIRKAVTGCLADISYPEHGRPALAEAAASGVIAKLAATVDDAPTVEHIQRLVIQWLWGTDLFAAAEAYQNYREHHRKKRALETACVFDRRAAFKPFDYPEAVKFKEAIQHSFWLVTEWNFVSDEHDFRVNLTAAERSAITRTLLAISQVEVAVKLFWVKLGERLPRSEFVQVGIVFGDSEIRHADAYSHLLERLGLNDEFRKVPTIPALQSRVDYLTRGLKTAADGDDRSFIKTLVTFSLLVENVSLFSQFAVMKSFSKHRKCLNNVDNVVQATQREELLHGLFGTYVVNLVRSERPEWFTSTFYGELADICRDALTAESGIIDWIFEDGELPFLPKSALVAFVKDRFNEGVVSVGGRPVFAVDPADLEPLKWFVEEIHAQVDVDFFHKRSVNYSSRDSAVTSSNIF